MSMPEEIKKQIEDFSRQSKHDEIVNYLKPILENGGLDPQELYEYAKGFYWPPSTTNYVINAASINKLGVFLSTLCPEKNCMTAKFYLLAAERDCSWGHANYASLSLEGTRGAEQSLENALIHAKKAIELTQKTASPHQHKYTYASVLRAHKSYSDAIINSMQYLGFAIQQKQDTNIKNALALCETMLNELLKDFQENASVNFTHENCRINLSALQLILSSSIQHEGLSALKEQAHFLAAKYHEYIGETSKAWISYCQEQDEKSPIYKEALIARRDLLKRFIEKQFEDLIILEIPLENLELEEKTSSSIEEDKKAPQNRQLLPNGIPFPLNFIKSWNKDTPKFHSVNDEMLKKEFAKRSKSIGKLIKAKKEEIALVDEVIKGNKSKELETKKPVLEAELKQLCEIEHDMQESHTLHTGNNRQVVRRHKTEKQFFDPKHLKKPDVLDKLKGLTLAIIDKRFSLDNSTQEPLSLGGYSSRMLITAERIFQEAVITLSGESNIALGIPRVKKKPWSIDTGYSYYSGTTGYGVVEDYQVSNTLIQAEHRTSPKRQRLGDSFLPQHKSYNADIYPTLCGLCNYNAENEKMIATYLIRYSKNHQTVTLEELQALNPNTVEDDVHRFNRIAFLIMEKEQAQWHSTTTNDYQLGMSVAQARALIMLEAGFLRLDEVCRNDVFFGTYSQTKIVDHPEKVAKACQRIEKLYTAFILQQPSSDSMRFFKSQIKTETKRTVVLTRQQAREDLQYVYGGETDSDGEGYDTDLEI